MRPIDTIRTSIDSDFVKYHGATLCKISSDNDMKSIRGIGLCAMVTPINKFDLGDKNTYGEENTFPVLIINRTPGWLETNLSKKYMVIAFNIVSDKTASSAVGFLVPSTLISDLRIFKESVDQRKIKDEDGKDIINQTKEYVSNE